jgi:hypothetical protein
VSKKGRETVRILALAIGGFGLAACGMWPTGPAETPEVAPARSDAFVTLIEGAGCELHQSDNDALLDPLGFSDAEASAISRELIAEGRAEINPAGNLVLLTENCI